MPSLQENTTPMPIGNPSNPANGIQVAMYKRVFYIVGFFFAFMILRNLFFRDYTGETKSYLTSTGHQDVIDKIIPKTREEYIQQQVNERAALQQLILNMSIVMEQYDSLRADMDALKVKVEQTAAPKTSTPAGTPIARQTKAAPGLRRRRTK
jgi:hypothetical protein